MGTTQTGQDVFSQLVYGTRITLLVGFTVGLIATHLSVVIGPDRWLLRWAGR